MAERSLGRKERRVESGGRLEIRDSLLGLIEMEQTGAAQELQIARNGPALDELSEQCERGRVIAAAVKRPHKTCSRIEVIGCEFESLTPFGGGLLIKAVGIVGQGAVKMRLKRGRQLRQMIISLVRELEIRLRRPVEGVRGLAGGLDDLAIMPGGKVATVKPSRVSNLSRAAWQHCARVHPSPHRPDE